VRYRFRRLSRKLPGALRRQAVCLDHAYGLGKASQRLRDHVIRVAGANEGTRAIKIDAPEDERLSQGAALLWEFAIETLPGDVVYGLVRAVARWRISTVEQFPIAVLAIDLPGYVLARPIPSPKMEMRQGG
jgi:hypothetical protein